MLTITIHKGMQTKPTMRYHFITVGPATPQMREQQTPVRMHHDGSATLCSFYGKYYRDFLQTRYRHAIGFSNPTTRFLLKRLELVQKRYTLHYAYNCIFHNSQNIDSIKVLSHEWIETMWCIHTVEYYSNLKNKTKQNSAICMKQVELEVFAVE